MNHSLPPPPSRHAVGRIPCSATIRLAIVAVAGWMIFLPTARAVQTVRVVCYNIEADVNGVTTPNSGLYTVLEAIGEDDVNGAAHPLDILALEETTSNAATVVPIVNALNSYYGAGTYAYVGTNFQATQNGSATTGNGPNAMVYNTTTLQLVLQNGNMAIGVAGTPSSSKGINRQVPRYEFQPLGAPANTAFYVYVSHMKSSSSGSSSADQQDRANEAQAIRADAATLPATASLLYMGDFNLDGSAESAYQTLTAPGTGQVVDPLNVPQNNAETWDTSLYDGIMTESSTKLDYRDDIQFMTSNVYGSTGVGLNYVAGSCHSFGNDGKTALGTSVNQASNTALATLQGPITASSALAALTTASDHLPLVADYIVATPYIAWQDAEFTAADRANPAVSGDLADPDGDGLCNLLEYALNLNPKSPDAAGAPVSGLMNVSGNTYLTLTYTQVIAATDISYVPQVSGDLVNWNSGTGYVVPVSVTANADGLTQKVVVRDGSPLAGSAARFMRLMITKP